MSSIDLGSDVGMEESNLVRAKGMVLLTNKYRLLYLSISGRRYTPAQGPLHLRELTR